ncbi:MAG: hypothetical protein EPN98_22840 [Phenylobacterium sp.]|nr:MAG: hypothetical protein EPN98_22840 [Phenylobacterium sp.]
MSYQLPIWVWPTVLMGVCAIAVLRGRDLERLAAASELATWALSLLVFKSRSESTQWAVLLIDVSLLVVLAWIALRSPRYWPLFAAGFQLLAVATHLAHATDALVSGWAYQTAALIWNYMTLFAIGYGAITAPRRYAEIDALGPPAMAGAMRR